MDLIQFLCNEKLKDLTYAKNVHELFITKTPFTAFVIHTPFVLFYFFPNANEIMTSQVVYYHFFIIRSILIGKYLNNLNEPELLKRSRLIRDNEIKTSLKSFFEVSPDDLQKFTVHFKIYQENGDLALKESGEVAFDSYVRANELFLLGLLLLINPDYNKQPNYWRMVEGAKLVSMADEPLPDDTEEYKAKYKIGKIILDELKKECTQCNALIVENKLNTQLWTRTVFKEDDELIKKFEKIKVKEENEMVEEENEMKNVVENKKDDEEFEIL
jgi:hypothetical protein